MADIVAPISYAIKHRQHAYNLAAYKGHPPSPDVQKFLLTLLLVFVADHKHCLFPGARPDAAVVVPSTRGRSGPHPLQGLIGERLCLPWISLVANSAVPAESRSFHRDRFTLGAGPPVQLAGASVLLLDDTWTTGAHVQAASFALKAAGAARVVALVLGRHVDPGYEPWKPIIGEIDGRPFRFDDCAAHTL